MPWTALQICGALLVIALATTVISIALQRQFGATPYFALLGLALAMGSAAAFTIWTKKRR